jgi:hypothetical protein
MSTQSNKLCHNNGPSWHALHICIEPCGYMYSCVQLRNVNKVGSTDISRTARSLPAPA